MSWQATAYVSELTTTPTGDTLTRSEKLLALLLANRHNPDSDIAWPSVSKLAKEALLSERRSRDLLHSLERKGVITIERRWVGPQQCATNLYRFPGLVRQGGGAIISPRRTSSPARHCPRVGQRFVPQGGAIAVAEEPSLNQQRTDSSLLAQEGKDHDRPEDYDAFNGVYGIHRPCGELHQMGTCVLVSAEDAQKEAALQAAWERLHGPREGVAR